MAENRVIIVHLRRPGKNLDESRSDPFWEFGSFGITGCHKENLMNPKNASRLEGVCFAFAQGGKQGTRLVYLTPPVEIVPHRSCVEAKWLPPKMPFRYDSAPILVSNSQESDFPVLTAGLTAVRRSTLEGKFASKYRAAATDLDDELAKELIQIYEERRVDPDSAIARAYVDALPWSPPRPDSDRKETYKKMERKAGRSKQRDVCGGRKRC
jgi:hypothetical protein